MSARLRPAFPSGAGDSDADVDGLMLMSMLRVKALRFQLARRHDCEGASSMAGWGHLRREWHHFVSGSEHASFVQQRVHLTKRAKAFLIRP